MARRRGSRVPGTTAIRTGRKGWTHFHQVAYSKGWKLQEGERIVAALPVRFPEAKKKADHA